LVLLHSNGLSSHEFDSSLQTLAERFDVVIWDMPGQGDSAPAPWDTPIEGYADAAADLIEDLGLHAPYIAGSSVGAFIAASLAARREHGIAGVILTEFQSGGPDWFDQNWDAVESLFAIPSMSDEQVQARLVQPVSHSIVRRWNIDRNKAGSRSMIGVMWAIRRFDIVAVLKATKTPVAVVFGDAGPTVSNIDTLRQVLGRGATFDIISGAGHFVSIDQPDRFATAIGSFVDLVTVASR
jgi:pimeloyl-ACP methyl ester carboxylesterase